MAKLTKFRFSSRNCSSIRSNKALEISKKEKEMSSPAMRQYNEFEVLKEFLYYLSGFARRMGVEKESWWEYHRFEVVQGERPWLLSGQVVRTSFLTLEKVVFKISIRLGWQDGEEIRRPLYWTAEWDKGPQYDFGALGLTLRLAENVTEMARVLGRDGVILEPSPEQLIGVLFGHAPVPKEKANGDGRHLEPLLETDSSL